MGQELVRGILVADNGEDMVVEFPSGEHGRGADVSCRSHNEDGGHRACSLRGVVQVTVGGGERDRVVGGSVKWFG